MAHDQQAEFFAPADDAEPILVLRVFLVVELNGVLVGKHGGGLLERHAVLVDVASVFVVVPVK
jgi:hypothetical protein